MTALDILTRCRTGGSEIEHISESIEMRRDALERCTRQLSGLPGGSGGTNDVMASMVGEIVDLEKALARRKRAFAAELCAGVWIVDLLPIPERGIIRGWFIDRKSLAAIAKAENYSISSVKRIRASGIEICREIDAGRMAGFLPEWYERSYINDGSQ